MPIKQIARQLGVAWNTVRVSLASDGPPRYRRSGKQSFVDEVEPGLRKLLRVEARMPATVIAERIVHEPGQAAQMDLWFPEPRIAVGFEQAMLPVLVMTLTFSRFLSAVMLPSRQAGDLLAGCGS